MVAGDQIFYATKASNKNFNYITLVLLTRDLTLWVSWVSEVSSSKMAVKYWQMYFSNLCTFSLMVSKSDHESETECKDQEVGKRCARVTSPQGYWRHAVSLLRSCIVSCGGNMASLKYTSLFIQSYIIQWLVDWISCTLVNGY